MTGRRKAATRDGAQVGILRQQNEPKTPAGDEGERTNEEGLLPCPFCGGKGAIEPYRIWDGYVRCRCGVTGPSRVTDAEAVEAWNARAALSPAQTGGAAVAFMTRLKGSDGPWSFLPAKDWTLDAIRAASPGHDTEPLYAAPVAEGAREAVRAAIRGTQLRNPLLGIYTVGGAINADILSDIEDAILQALDTGTNRGGG